MTQKYWDKLHTHKFDGDWASKPSQFAEYGISFFPKTGKILSGGGISSGLSREKSGRVHLPCDIF